MRGSNIFIVKENSKVVDFDIKKLFFQNNSYVIKTKETETKLESLLDSRFIKYDIALKEQYNEFIEYIKELDGKISRLEEQLYDKGLGIDVTELDISKKELSELLKLDKNPQNEQVNSKNNLIDSNDISKITIEKEELEALLADFNTSTSKSESLKIGNNLIYDNKMDLTLNNEAVFPISTAKEDAVFSDQSLILDEASNDDSYPNNLISNGQFEEMVRVDSKLDNNNLNVLSDGDINMNDNLEAELNLGGGNIDLKLNNLLEENIITDFSDQFTMNESIQEKELNNLDIQKAVAIDSFSDILKENLTDSLSGFESSNLYNNQEDPKEQAASSKDDINFRDLKNHETEDMMHKLDDVYVKLHSLSTNNKNFQFDEIEKIIMKFTNQDLVSKISLSKQDKLSIISFVNKVEDYLSSISEGFSFKNKFEYETLQKIKYILIKK